MTISPLHKSVKPKKAPKLSFIRTVLSRNKNHGEQMLVAANVYGGVVLLTRWMKLYLVSSASAIHRLAKENVDNYDKFFPRYARLGEILGAGLLTLFGKHWWHRRKLLQPYFTHKQMPDLAAIASEKTREFINRWRVFAKTKEPVCLTNEVMVLVLQVSVRLLFTYDLDYKKALSLTKSFSKANRSVARAVSMRWWLPSVRQWQAKYEKAKIDKFIKLLIEQRRANPNPPEDFLQTLLTAKDEYTGKPLTKKCIYDEVRTFLGTGHETTGLGLVWSMILLEQNPDALEKLHQELDNSVLAGDLNLSLQDLEKLPYNKQVFQETLRLYPPIWAVARRSVETDELDGYTIPKNATLIVAPYVNHRLEKHWLDPEAFNPDRFTPEAVKARDKLAYIPFGVGPHSCIASVLSMVQGQISQAMLCKAFDMEFLSDDFSEELFFTLRPKYPIYVRLTER